MSALVIPFPQARLFRDPDVLEATEKLAMCDEMIASGDPVKVGVAEVMRGWWLKELARLTGADATVH